MICEKRVQRKGCESMSVNSPVPGLRDKALARAVAPVWSGAVRVPTRSDTRGGTRDLNRRARRFPGAHRDPHCTFWRTVAQELLYFGTAGHVQLWRDGR